MKRIIEIDADKDGAFMRVDGRVVAELPDYVELRVDVKRLKLYGRNSVAGVPRPQTFPFTIILDRDEDGLFADINGTLICAPSMEAVLDLLREIGHGWWCDTQRPTGEPSRSRPTGAPILIWPFDTAPPKYAALSTNGGDEDWLAFVPDSLHTPELEFTLGGDASTYAVDGGVVKIWSHA